MGILNRVPVAHTLSGAGKMLQNAQDGDVIGITFSIEIVGETVTPGSDDKHIYIVRSDEFGVIKVICNGNLTMKNVTVDGGGKPGQGAMIYVEQGHLTLNAVTMRRCDGGNPTLSFEKPVFAGIFLLCFGFIISFRCCQSFCMFQLMGRVQWDIRAFFMGFLRIFFQHLICRCGCQLSVNPCIPRIKQIRFCKQVFSMEFKEIFF